MDIADRSRIWSCRPAAVNAEDPLSPRRSTPKRAEVARRLSDLLDYESAIVLGAETSARALFFADEGEEQIGSTPSSGRARSSTTTRWDRSRRRSPRF
jgi:hypothetical protein